MDLGLADRVAVVAGSSRGIGKAIARRLLEEGARVAISGRSDEALEGARREFSAAFAEGRVLAYRGDLREAQHNRKFLEAVLSRWSRVDVAVANVGLGAGQLFEACDEAEWQRMTQLNLTASMLFAREAASAMARQRAGAICLIASIAGREALSAPIPYTAAKAGLIAAGKALARQLAASNIRVNVVAPGNVLCPGGDWERRLSANRDEVMRYINSDVPMKRFGTPEEIAACVAFLCSSAASFVTGACVTVDGGQTHGF